MDQAHASTFRGNPSGTQRAAGALGPDNRRESLPGSVQNADKYMIQ